jgi:hypothetical protein
MTTKLTKAQRALLQAVADGLIRRDDNGGRYSRRLYQQYRVDTGRAVSEKAMDALWQAPGGPLIRLDPATPFGQRRIILTDAGRAVLDGDKPKAEETP